MTSQEAEDLGWDTFEAALGSTPYGSDVESHWRVLFHDAFVREIGWINAGGQARIDFLSSLATWMGDYAAALPSPDGWVRLSQLVKAFVAVRAYGRSLNNDKPTQICN